MPNYQGDILTGFDSNAIFDLKIDTFKTMSDVLNRPDNPMINLQENSTPQYDIPKGFTYEDAIISDDPKIRDLGIKHLEQVNNESGYYSLGLGKEIRTPYEQASKYINKKWGYDATIPDIEDFYYDKTWGRMSTFGRMWRTPFKMAARIIPQAFMKLGEGLGYVGSMITSIGSTNYWADVADNGVSKWIEGLEQKYKDVVIPVYKQAGFNEKGFLQNW